MTKETDFPSAAEVLNYKLTNGGFVVSGAKCSVIAKELLKRHILLFATIKNSEKGFIYRYDESGVYLPMQERELKKIIKDFLEHYDEKVVTKSNINEISELMITDMKGIDINTFNSDRNIINFKNGVLHLDTLELKPHSENYLCSIQMPVNWNTDYIKNPESAIAPVFDKYLDTLTALKSPEDAADTKTLFLEIIGVILSNVPGYKFKKALLVFGKGNTGKTQIRNLTISLIGNDNSAVVELEDLESREGPSRAYGKRLIGSGDMKYGTASQIATFKDVTGGETVPIRYLYKEAFTGTINGVFWFGANCLPLFGGDKGSWVYDRFIPIRCDNVIPEEERDPDLLDKMLAEKEAIVFKAVLAMREAVNRGYKYTIPKCSRDDLETYKSENSIIVEFFNDYCVQLLPPPGAAWEAVSTKSEHSKREIYKAFCNWAKDNYRSCPTKKEFEETIADILNIGVKALSTRTSEQRVYYGFDITFECAETYLTDY